MAVWTTVTRSRYNVWGNAGGIPNPVVYVGPTIDLDGADSPITVDNTYRVTRFNESTGAAEHYEPGGLGTGTSNDFHTLDRGSLGGGADEGSGLGRHYVIFAKSDFVMPHCTPG